MYPLVKRSTDIAFSIVGLVFLVPTYLVVRIAYLCTGDFHRIIYTQTRIGKNGKKFKMYKFRTMVPNAEQELKKVLKDPIHKKEWKKFHKIGDDPRITKVGKLIRRGSVDELPQILNVLTGDLAIVGPRPLVPGEIEQYKGEKEIYESVRPGITGWWAVNGRSDMEYDDRLALEYYYINNSSAKLDTQIFFKTIGVVFSHRGAK